VNFVQAALGRGRSRADVRPEKTSIKIPPGTQPGTMFRVKGKGIKNIQGYATAICTCALTSRVPTHLSSAQKAKLQEFQRSVQWQGGVRSAKTFDKAKNLSVREWSAGGDGVME